MTRENRVSEMYDRGDWYSIAVNTFKRKAILLAVLNMCTCTNG